MIEVRRLPARFKNTGISLSYAALYCAIEASQRIPVEQLAKKMPAVIAGFSTILGGVSVMEIIETNSEIDKLPVYVNTLDIAENKLKDAKESLETRPRVLMKVGEWSVISSREKADPKAASESLKLINSYLDVFQQEGLHLDQVIDNLGNLNEDKQDGKPSIDSQKEIIEKMEEKVHTLWESPERKQWEKLRDKTFPFKLGAALSFAGMLYLLMSKRGAKKTTQKPH
ncbi:MAG: hypothetical protein Q7K55_09505 [Candidatus Levybacteria bacterium]|nr:hypothetical protein [Candidatus Levybacteria bacterium]